MKPQVVHVEKKLPGLTVRKQNCNCALHHDIERPNRKLLQNPDLIHQMAIQYFQYAPANRNATLGKAAFVPKFQVQKFKLSLKF